jgi:TPR repeat protein
LDILNGMSRRRGRIIGAALMAVALAAVAQTTGIDPALLAKATSGDAPSQVALGEAYEKASTKADYAQAAAWYRKAADQNNADAQIHLAVCYRDGRGVQRDMAQAAEWYRKAAELGSVSAQGTLGLLYSIGQGVPQNDVEAYYWLALAAAVKGPSREKYAANRQSMAARITADELADAQDRVTKWIAAHPRPGTTE